MFAIAMLGLLLVVVVSAAVVSFADRAAADLASEAQEFHTPSLGGTEARAIRPVSSMLLDDCVAAGATVRMGVDQIVIVDTTSSGSDGTPRTVAAILPSARTSSRFGRRAGALQHYMVSRIINMTNDSITVILDRDFGSVFLAARESMTLLAKVIGTDGDSLSWTFRWIQ